MGEEFEDRDLSESVFWGVQMTNATFRDAVLNGSTFFHTEWENVSIDGVINGLVINGVDVTGYVNANDRWYPLRTQLFPQTVEGLNSTWSAIRAEWDSVMARVPSMGADVVTTSVNGEWSLRDTLRHLLFAMDKWFTWPILGVREFSAMGLPNTGSQGLEWPGIDMGVDPSFAEVVAARAQRTRAFTDHLASLDMSNVPETVEVLENGTVPGLMCFHVVFEEEFEHLRYALRDLATLGF
ncbi:MAG: DinB family protein [Ilumatobacteraceae bacterium]